MTLEWRWYLFAKCLPFGCTTWDTEFLLTARTLLGQPLRSLATLSSSSAGLRLPISWPHFGCRLHNRARVCRGTVSQRLRAKILSIDGKPSAKNAVDSRAGPAVSQDAVAPHLGVGSDFVQQSMSVSPHLPFFCTVVGAMCAERHKSPSRIQMGGTDEPDNQDRQQQNQTTNIFFSTSTDAVWAWCPGHH